MRLPRKIKKAAKYVEFHAQHSTSGLSMNLYDEFVVKGRHTKWKMKCLDKAESEYLRRLAEG